jgi:hypothetical protein
MVAYSLAEYPNELTENSEDSRLLQIDHWQIRDSASKAHVVWVEGIKYDSYGRLPGILKHSRVHLSP